MEPIRALASPEVEPSPADDPLRAGRLCLELPSPLHTLVRCRVCGFSEVHTDEVVHRGVLILAECPRCEHRWTAPAAAPPRRAPDIRRVRRARPADGEGAAAA